MILLLFIIMKTKAVPHVSILVPSIMQNGKKKHPLNHSPPSPRMRITHTQGYAWKGAPVMLVYFPIGFQ